MYAHPTMGQIAPPSSHMWKCCNFVLLPDNGYFQLVHNAPSNHNLALIHCNNSTLSQINLDGPGAHITIQSKRGGSHGLECTVMGCGRKHNGLMGKVSLNTEHRTHGAQKGKSSFLDFYRENVYQILSGFHLLCGIKYSWKSYILLEKLAFTQNRILTQNTFGSRHGYPDYQKGGVEGKGPRGQQMLPW